MGSGEKKDKDKHNPMKQINKAKKCMDRLKKCSICWMLFSILFFIVGIIVLIFFAKYIGTDVWQK